MTAQRDPYEVLGVPRGASTRQIRAAYVTRARGAHPDLVGQRGLDVMRALNEAWGILKDDERRAAYDAARGGPAKPGGQPAASSSHNGADTSRPFWTGAMGTPPGRPWGSVLDAGIYAGWSVGEIMRQDRGYLAWLAERPEGAGLRAEIRQALHPNGDDEAASGRDQRDRRDRRR